MTTNSSNKWILTRLALPVATALAMLAGCKSTPTSEQSEQDEITITIIDNRANLIDSLLQANHKLTDSLNVVNTRLDSCEAARAKRCPCEKKPTTPTQKKKPVKKAPTPAKPVVSQPASTKIIIDNNNAGNNAVVIGNNNNVNNVVINGCTEIVLDTLGQVQTTRRIMSGHAKTTYTYTK